MKQFILAISIIALISGCTWFTQVKEDYALGKSVPLEQGEVSPSERAAAVATTVSGIPYVGVAAPIILLGGGFVFTWLRGRRLRKEKLPVNDHPITGVLGKSVGAEAIIQNTANLAMGALDVGKKETPSRSAWQYTLVSSLGILLAPLAGELVQKFIPYLQDHHPAWLSASMMAIVIGLLGAAKTWLSKVEPYKPPVTA